MSYSVEILKIGKNRAAVKTVAIALKTSVNVVNRCNLQQLSTVHKHDKATRETSTKVVVAVTRETYRDSHD